MPAVVPPFPVVGSPHVDLQIRDLYRRMSTIERILRISEPPTVPAPTPVPVSARVVPGRVVYCARGALHYNQGWGSYGELWEGYALYLLKLYPPSLVLSATAHVSEVFESDEELRSPYGPFTLTDIEPHELGPDVPPLLPRFARYWGGEFDPDIEHHWVSSPIAIDLKVPAPRGGGYWYNVGTFQPSGRRGNFRGGVADLPYLPFTCGYTFAGEPALASALFLRWPEGMRGAVTFIAVWIDNFEGRVVSVSFGGRPGRHGTRKLVFIAVKPVKVGSG